ncbi:hypothetical protein AY599_18065 [Leptolyngbya valderiana BDU 20041]|nr:hypothetical protein AY599_18065 [Leptolyngbya valderiana BDU 20041]
MSIVKPRCLSFLLMLSAGLPFSLHAGADWQITSHPCPGASRTDALQKDSDGTLWVGCGTTASGIGLFTSPDGGDSWQAVTTSPADVVDEFRVTTLTRGHDGALYAGGIDTTAGTNLRVVRLDTSGAMPYPTTATLTSVAQVGRQFTVGSYAELSDGRALADSLTGFDRLYRPDAVTGASAADWDAPSTGLESFVDLIAFNDGFYAAGSRINIPPRIFLPPTAPGAEPWELVEVILDPAYDGEMWGIAVNSQRVVAVGVNQDSDQGRIYVSSGDPYVAANYNDFFLSEITQDGMDASWARGVCMRGDTIVVVGERQPLGSNTGRVVISTDGGQSFDDITPKSSSESITRCAIAESGLVTVVGAGGFVGRYSGALVPDSIFSNRFESN